MPNHGSSLGAAANTCAARWRVLVGMALPLGVLQSHSTSTCGAPRNGSVHTARGLMITSESSPGACPVEDPSKFQSLSSPSLTDDLP